MAKPVLVYGASGHTGRFVVDELLARGEAVVLSGRRAESLEPLGRSSGLPVRAASLEDPATLAAALSGCAAVINCAGPFLDTAEPLVAAAIRAGVAYLDLTAEQASAQATFDLFDAPARQAKVAVMPAMAFYGGLGDLLATAVMADWEGADRLDFAVALDSWRPTEGTRETGRRNTAPRVVVREGRLQRMETPAWEGAWRFPAPFDEQAVVELPFSEMILVHHHLKVPNVRSVFTTRPLADLRDPNTPAPEASDAKGRSSQRFLLECRVTRDGIERRGWVAGQDIYAVTAPLVAAAAARLARLDVGGVFAPGEVLDAREVLESLSPEPFELRLDEAA